MKGETCTVDSPASHIAYVASEYPKMSHTFILREVRALRARGIEIETCTIRRVPEHELVGPEEQDEARRTFPVLATAKRPLRLIGSHLEAFARSPGRWVSALRLAWRTRSPGPKAALWQLFYFLEAGVLAQHLRQMGVTHLHAHFANSGCSVAMLTSEMSGLPFSFTLHGPNIFFEPMRWRLDEKIAQARFVACITHFCRSQAMLFSDQSHWDRLRIVHCGIETGRYDGPERASFGKNVLFVGRLDAVKGATLLLRAFATLRARHPEARLTMVGDGAIRGALEAEALALGIGAATTFTGYLSQGAVAAQLAEADMLALPSFAEGLPVVLMEALASGIPVVASQIAGIPELVRNGETGFVVPAGDVETLTARLDQLMSDPELCRRMGAAGRALVRAEHDITREAEWLAAIFAGQADRLRPS